MVELVKGNVAAIFTAQAKAQTEAEWEKDVESVWDEAVEILKSNRGFKGLLALWNHGDNGEVCIIGLWEDIETRLNYEATTAQAVRDLFNSIFTAVPNRPRFVVTGSYTQ